MGGNMRVAAFILPMAIIFMAGHSSVQPTPFNTFGFSAPYALENNGKTLDLGVGNEQEYHIDVSGLEVNLACSENLYVDLNKVRIELLQGGCAKIIGVPANPAEAAAQAAAKAQHIGIWAEPQPGNTPTNNGHSVVWRILHWIATHELISIPGIGLLVAIIGSPWLLGLLAWLLQIFRRRKVNIIIAGATASGKTGLWTAWKYEYDPGVSGMISHLPASPGPQRADLISVPAGKWTLQPRLVDTAGSQPDNVLHGVLRRKGLRGRIAELRTRNILVYVVSPGPQENPIPGGNQFNKSYIDKQEGGSTLPVALIRERDPRVKVDLVMMFASKFDLLDTVAPKDSTGSAPGDMAREFRPHRELIESACKYSGTPFIWIIGSAKRGWGIDQLRIGLQRYVVK